MTPALPDNAAPAYGAPANPSKDTQPTVATHPHAWVGSATVELDAKTAARAARYLSYRAPEGQKIDVLEVYCSGCRRNLLDVAKGAPCAAKVNNEHLIGGDQRVRAKRKHYELPETVTVSPGPRINRRGIGAILSGEA